MIVEHVVRNESTAPMSTQTRIRTFSGRMPRPNGEVDYDTWRTQVDLLLSDSSIHDIQKVRKILESLLSPASEVVKPLGINSPSDAYVVQLDSAFGVVEDGEELFAAFSQLKPKHRRKNLQHTSTGSIASSLEQFLEGEPLLKTLMTSYSDSSVGAVGIRASS